VFALRLLVRLSAKVRAWHLVRHECITSLPRLAGDPFCLCVFVLHSSVCLNESLAVGAARVTRVTRMAYSPSLWLMAIGW